MKVNEGHRASDWGDLGNPLWKGRLRIIERSQGVGIQFEDATTGECMIRSIDINDALGLGERAVLLSSLYLV